MYEGKKKILFCLQTMILGGVEKELITILKRMSPEKYDITVLLLYVSDLDVVKQIPHYVRVINLDIDRKYYCASLLSLCKERLKRGYFIEASNLFLKRILHIGHPHTNTNIANIPSMNESFDIAVCYHMHAPLSLRYVAEKVAAVKKIAWIHNDFFTTGFPVKNLRGYLDCYQDIVAVSRQVEYEFLQCCVGYDANKVHMCHNIVDQDEIFYKSNELIEDPVYFKEKGSKLLTIGRFSSQKGFDIAIKAACLLKTKNIDFKWFFIGEGEQEEEYRRLIAEYDLTDRIVILGRKNNPYPYIKHCDIYVQPSRHEAYAITILEAKTLNKPIICSRFSGAEEQIVDGKTGLIVPVCNENALSVAIEKLLLDLQLKNLFTISLQEEHTKNDWHNIEELFK